MAAPQFGSFAVVTLLVVTLLVVLARASAAMFDGSEEGDDRTGADGFVPETGAERIERHADVARETPEDRILDEASDAAADGETTADSPWQEDTESPWDDESPHVAATTTDRNLHAGPESFSPGMLLANVAVSQGLFGLVVVGAAWFADLPLATLGVVPGDPWNLGLPALALGLGVGVALYAGNEVAANLADAAGVEYSESLREALAPDSLAGWAILLVVVLPIIAGFEELLFRAALIGAFAAGFGVSPWMLAVLSSVVFAVGHGAQGQAGVVVTGLLGFALAGVFVVTGSLLVVVVAHYVVNALEFVIHEGLGVEWA